jgi:hypothetical protein
MSEKVIVKELKNQVIVSSPGPQGPRGKTILNGSTAPANNLGLSGDFYYNTETTEFYGPKKSDGSWSDAAIIVLNNVPEHFQASWELNQLVGPVDGVYSVEITHGLGFSPNVTVKSSAGDTLETGVEYSSLNKITLTMAQPFSGTVFLS